MYGESVQSIYMEVGWSYLILVVNFNSLVILTRLNLLQNICVGRQKILEAKIEADWLQGKERYH